MFMQTRTNEQLRTAECNGGRIYVGESSIGLRNATQKDRPQRGEPETIRVRQHNNDECGHQAEHSLMGAITNNANSDKTRGRERGYKRRYLKAAATKASPLGASESNTTRQVESILSEQEEKKPRVEQESNSDQKQQRHRQRQYRYRRTRRRLSGRQSTVDHKPSAEISEEVPVETTTTGNKPNYLASLDKLSLSLQSRAATANNSGNSDSQLNEPTYHKDNYELSSLSQLESREVVLDHYIKHNIEEESASERCGCHFNHLRGSQRKRNLLSELEEFHRKFYSKKSATSNSDFSCSSGRLTARASELSIEGDASCVNASVLVATHLEQTRNLKLDKPAVCNGTSLPVAVDCHSSVLNKRALGHGGLFIDDEDDNESDFAPTRGANRNLSESIAQLAHTCSTSSSSCGLLEQPNQRKAQENDNQQQKGDNESENKHKSTTDRSNYFHCQCYLARINSPNSIAAAVVVETEAEAEAATVDGYKELLIGQREQQQREQQGDQQEQTTTSESLLATSSSLPIVSGSNEEDRQVSSLSWDKFDLFEQSQTQLQQFTTSGGRLTPTARFCKGNSEAPPVLSARSGNDNQVGLAFKREEGELPFSFEEAESILTDELDLSATGSALESFAETSSLEESRNDNKASIGPGVCDCACNCCSEQRRRQQQEGAKSATANLSSWSISDNLVQQLKQLVDSDNSFRQRQRRLRRRAKRQQHLPRPNCCCQTPRSFDPSQQRFGDFCSLTTDNSTLSLSWPRDSSSPNDYDGYNDDNRDNVNESRDEEQKAERIIIQPSATTQAARSAPKQQLEQRELGDLNFKPESIDDVDYPSRRFISETLATAAARKRRRPRKNLRKGKSSPSCSDEKFERFACSKESPERSAHIKKTKRTWDSSIDQTQTLEAIEFSSRTLARRRGNNCFEKEPASCKMGIDGASSLSSELAVGSSTQGQSATKTTGPTTKTYAAESARVVAEEESQKKKKKRQELLSTEGGSNNSKSSNKQKESSCDSSVADANTAKIGGLVCCSGSDSNEESPPQQSGQNNSEISRRQLIGEQRREEDEEQEEDASGYTSASGSMKAVRDIAKMSIPSLSALQYLPGQLDSSGRPKFAMQAYVKQPQQQQPQSSQQLLRQPLSPLPTNVDQQQQKQMQPATIAGNTVRVITESGGEDLQHDESCLIHRLCMCNCMSRQQHAAGSPDPAASSTSAQTSAEKRGSRHVKRSKVKRSSSANATTAATGDIDSDKAVGELVKDENEAEEEDGDDSGEELSTRSEGIKRRVVSSGNNEKQSPTLLGFLKSSAAAVHLTRRQPSNLVHQQQRRSADLIMAKKLGSAGDLEASATGSASSSRNDSDLATSSGSLSYLRSRSTSFTASEQRRAQSPNSNDYTSIVEDDCFDDSLVSSSNPLSRSQSACGSHPPTSSSAKQETTAKGAGSRAKSAYKKLLSPSRLFSSRSPSPQPTLLEQIATSARDKGSSIKQQEQQGDDADNDDGNARKQQSDNNNLSFLTRSLNRLSGRKGSKRQQQEAKKLEAKAATVGSDPNISAFVGSPGAVAQNQSVSISHSNLSNIRQPEDSASVEANNSSLNSSLADEVALPLVQQSAATLRTARQVLVGQQQQQQQCQQKQGVNRLVTRAPQARLTPQIVLSRAEFIAAQAGNNPNKGACDMARIRGYKAEQERPQHYHYGSGTHTASMSSQRFGSEISADLSTTSGDNLSERALSLPASPRTTKRYCNQDRRQNPSPRLKESPVPFRSPATESTKIEDGLEVCSMEHFEKHIGNIKDTQVETQKYLFTTWINHFCPNLIQRDLVGELKDGIKLIGLIASLTKDKDMISHYERLARDKRAYINRIVVTPSSRLRHLSNVSIAIDHLREKVGMKLINLNPMDVVSGKPNVVLGLCWSIILHFQFEQNFLKHLETCEDPEVLLTERTLKSWVSYEEARRRLKDWLATAEAKLCDALGPIIMMNSNEELATNQAIGISSASQSQCSLATFDPILQHTDRLEDLIKYFELEEAEDPVLGASSGQLASLSRQLSNDSSKSGHQQAVSASSTPLRQPNLQAHQQQSSLENLRAPPTPTNNNSSLAGGDCKSISGSLLSLGSCSSQMSSLQSSKNATYRKLFDDFAAKCRLLAGMLGRNQKDALLLGVKELKTRLKYITEQRVPQVVSELRMSINRCEMSIKEQDEQRANLSTGDESELSTDINGGDDSNEATSDLEESKEGDEENSDDNDDDDNVGVERILSDQPQRFRSASSAISTVAEKPPICEINPTLATADTINLTGSSKTTPPEEASVKVAVGGERMAGKCAGGADEQKVVSKKDKNSSRYNTNNKNSKNKRATTRQAAASTDKAGNNSQPVKTHADQQRGKQAAGASEQVATAFGTWLLSHWPFSSNQTDSSHKLVAKSSTNSNKKRKHMSSHKSGKGHKSRNSNNKNSPSSKQQMSSKVAEEGTRANLDTDDFQSISFTGAVWHKIVSAYRTNLPFSIVLLISLVGICVLPLMNREACCDPSQPSQILSEEALSMNERPT